MSFVWSLNLRFSNHTFLISPIRATFLDPSLYVIILLVRDGFTVQLMKLPSIAWAPSKDPRGALAMPYKCPKVLQLMYERNLMVFQSWTTILKICMALPIMSCEAEKKFSNRSIIKKNVRSATIQERMNYLSILSK